MLVVVLVVVSVGCFTCLGGCNGSELLGDICWSVEFNGDWWNDGWWWCSCCWNSCWEEEWKFSLICLLEKFALNLFLLYCAPPPALPTSTPPSLTPQNKLFLDSFLAMIVLVVIVELLFSFSKLDSSVISTIFNWGDSKLWGVKLWKVSGCDMIGVSSVLYPDSLIVEIDDLLYLWELTDDDLLVLVVNG